MSATKKLLRTAISVGFAISAGWNLPLLPALAQEIGFNERFALAKDREAVLTELIPGTEPYFYYNCLHNQTVGKTAQARSFLDAWLANSGENDQNRRMRTRQLLIEYSSNPQLTLAHLRGEFGFSLNHTRPQRDEAAVLASVLDPKLIDWESHFKNIAKQAGGLSAIEDVGLWQARPWIENLMDKRAWVGRVDRPDIPGLLDTLEEELRQQNSQGFGWAKIHNELTLDQLNQLRKRLPSLIQSNAYVQAVLRRLRPSDDQSLADPAVMRRHLEILENFANELPESQNSLLATILFHRLRVDAIEGKFDRERFLRYLKLPCNRPNINADYLKSLGNRPQVNPQSNFFAETLLTPIGDDSSLVRLYLEHFFRSDKNVDSFAPLIERGFLQRVFATTKILFGLGDPKTYYATLSPEEQRELQSRVELRFSPNNPNYYRPTDKVRLDLEMKNVSDLIVKIYRLNARNILSQQLKPINTDIDVDGLVANVERRLEYAQPSDRRHTETIELPELEGSGVWVVDVLAGGQRSRALIHKGHLQSIASLSDAGHVLRIIDADGNHVPSAKVLLGEVEFAPDDEGDIVIPFSREARTQMILLTDGSLASLEMFAHLPESYELQGGFILDPQAITAGSKTAVVIRPTLLCNRQRISLERLEAPQLVITTTDLNGTVATKTFGGLRLKNNAELVQTFLVPPRLARIDVLFSAQVHNFSLDVKQSISVSHSLEVNEMARSQVIGDFFLAHTDQGYSLESRGRNGEPLTRQPVQCEFKLHAIQTPVSVRLASDATGTVVLGQLPRVEWIRVSSDGVQPRTFAIQSTMLDWPSTLQSMANQPIVLPWPEPDRIGKPDDPSSIVPSKLYPQQFSLFEYRNGTLTASHSDKIAVAAGTVRIEGLKPGSYRLTHHLTGRSVAIRTMEGREQGSIIVGQNGSAEKSPLRPVHIASAGVDAGKLMIQIDNSYPLTRVHLIATSYDHSRRNGGSMPTPELPIARADRIRIPSYYLNSLRLDEEYQYVLQRQLTKKYSGTLLPHPSVLLNPWELSATNNQRQSAATGDPLSALAADMPALAPGQAKEKADKLARLAAAMSPEYEFLQRGMLLAPNLRCDAKGKIEFDAKELAGLSSVTILVVHPTTTTYRTVSIPWKGERPLVDRRLQKSFDVDKHLAERQQVLVLANRDKHDLGDASSTRARLYTSIADLFVLYRTLLQSNAQFERFQVLTRWGSLTDPQKEVHYGELACHELHLFLYHHDRPFFDKVVKPILKSKLHRQFMDDWLLDGDLSDYLRPWRLAQLNTAERALLAKRLQPQLAPARRWINDALAANPMDPSLRSRLFETSMMGTAVIDSAGAGGLGDVYFNRFSLQQEEREAFGVWGAKAATSTNGAYELGMMYSDLDGVVALDDASENRPEAGSELRRDLTLAEVVQELDSKAHFRKKSSLGRRAMYATLEQTKKWAESQFFRIPLGLQTAELIRPNAFWQDYLLADPQSPFLSRHVDLAGSSINEALIAMALLQLPLQSDAPEFNIENGRLMVSNVKSAIAYVQGIQGVDPSEGPNAILVSQNIYLASQAADANAKPISDQPLLIGVPYRLRVVLTNPTASAIRVQILTQVPQGSIPLENGKVDTANTVDLAPYSTKETGVVFYFPRSGNYSLYGAHVSSGDKHLLAAPAATLRVLDRPETVDETTWEYLAAWGTEEQVMRYLQTANLSKVQWELTAWRLADRAFFDTLTRFLSEMGVYPTTVWQYALLHNQPNRLREFVEATPSIAQRVGPVLKCELMEIEPIHRLQYEHLDFRPIVVARSHLLGTKRTVLNDGLFAQYNTLLNLLSGQRSIEDAERLSLVYYFILQNRLEEAIEHFAMIDSQRFDGVMQYDYFACYLDMVQDQFDQANERALRYVELPHPRWRDLFAQVRGQIQERKQMQSGKWASDFERDAWKTDAGQRILSGTREQQIAESARKQSTLDWVQEGESIFVQHRNLEEITVNYYLMDIELLFSRNPFVQQNGGRIMMIQPNGTESIRLAASDGVSKLPLVLPEAMKNRNLVVEVVAAGMKRSLSVYANSLLVNVANQSGRLQVLTKGDQQPLSKAYVKVYAKRADGSVQFYKDGYTDLRGAFDYASLSTNDLDSTQRFSILVLHPTYGALIRESEPPKR